MSIDVVKEASKECTVIPCAFWADAVVACNAFLTLGPDIPDTFRLGKKD